MISYIIYIYIYMIDRVYIYYSVYIYIFIFICIFICIYAYIYIVSTPKTPPSGSRAKVPRKMLTPMFGLCEILRSCVRHIGLPKTMEGNYVWHMGDLQVPRLNMFCESWILNLGKVVPSISIKLTMSLVRKLQPCQWCCMFGNDNSCFQSDAIFG